MNLFTKQKQTYRYPKQLMVIQGEMLGVGPNTTVLFPTLSGRIPDNASI